MIILKKAHISKRKEVYNWLYFSDFSSFLNNLQGYDKDTIPSYIQFSQDYADFFFDDSRNLKGEGYMIISKKKNFEEEIGFISFTSFHLRPGVAEIDIWLKSLKYTGKGYGTSAINILSDKLLEMDFNTLIIRPCKKNTKAVKSYKKAGFEESELIPEKYYKKEFIEEYGPGDCGQGQDVFMIKHLTRN